MTLTLGHFLVVSALLLAAGVLTLFMRRSVVGALMGIELIISAAALNLVAFDAFDAGPNSGSPRLDGQVFAFFILLTGALQTALALAIFLNRHGQAPPAEAGPPSAPDTQLTN